MTFHPHTGYTPVPIAVPPASPESDSSSTYSESDNAPLMGFDGLPTYTATQAQRKFKSGDAKKTASSIFSFFSAPKCNSPLLSPRSQGRKRRLVNRFKKVELIVSILLLLAVVCAIMCCVMVWMAGIKIDKKVDLPMDVQSSSTWTPLSQAQEPRHATLSRLIIIRRRTLAMNDDDLENHNNNNNNNDEEEVHTASQENSPVVDDDTAADSSCNDHEHTSIFEHPVGRVAAMLKVKANAMMAKAIYAQFMVARLFDRLHQIDDARSQ